MPSSKIFDERKRSSNMRQILGRCLMGGEDKIWKLKITFKITGSMSVRVRDRD